MTGFLKYLLELTSEAIGSEVSWLIRRYLVIYALLEQLYSILFFLNANFGEFSFSRIYAFNPHFQICEHKLVQNQL